MKARQQLKIYDHYPEAFTPHGNIHFLTPINQLPSISMIVLIYGEIASTARKKTTFWVPSKWIASSNFKRNRRVYKAVCLKS